jgi:hypothetical protein
MKENVYLLKVKTLVSIVIPHKTGMQTWNKLKKTSTCNIFDNFHDGAWFAYKKSGTEAHATRIDFRF